MSTDDRVEIKLFLLCKDADERNHLYQLLSDQISQTEEVQDPAPEIVITEVHKAPVRLGTVDTAFLLGMSLGVATSATGIGAWCMAHYRGEGGPLRQGTKEAQEVIAAVTAEQSTAAPPPKSATEK